MTSEISMSLKFDGDDYYIIVRHADKHPRTEKIMSQLESENYEIYKMFDNGDDRYSVRSNRVNLKGFEAILVRIKYHYQECGAIVVIDDRWY